MKSFNINLKQRWGQNFLINRGARQKIISLIAPESNDVIWEIGPGLGCLTEALLPGIKRLIAFEIDRGFIRFLKEHFPDQDKLRLIKGDVLKTWRQVGKTQGIPRKVVGNLPYSSASALIASFVENDFYPSRMVFAVQKELTGRMTAVPGTKNYSSFSIICQFAYHIREFFELKPGSFYPAPDVISSVIELKPRKAEYLMNRRFFLRLVQGLFGSRRKTLRNNLLNLLNSPALKGFSRELLLRAMAEEGIDPSIRAEELPPGAFIRLANRLQGLLKNLQGFQDAG